MSPVVAATIVVLRSSTSIGIEDGAREEVRAAAVWPDAHPLADQVLGIGHAGYPGIAVEDPDRLVEQLGDGRQSAHVDERIGARLHDPDVDRPDLSMATLSTEPAVSTTSP